MNESNIAALFYWLGGGILVGGTFFQSATMIVIGLVVIGFPILKHKA